MKMYVCGKCKAESGGVGTLRPPEGWREFQTSDGQHYTLCRDCRLTMVEDLLLDKAMPRLKRCETVTQVIMDILQTNPGEEGGK